MMSVPFEAIHDSAGHWSKRRFVMNAGWSVGQVFAGLAIAVAMGGMAIAGIGAGITAGVMQLVSQALR
jgi:hypothetical protein